MTKTLTDEDFKVEHLNLSKVTIDFGTPQIIWAPNGVGKTSLYKGIQRGQLPSASFTEFNDNRAEFAKEAKDTLRIGAHVRKLDELQSRRQRLLDGCDMPGGLKEVGLTAVKPIKAALPSHPDCKKNLDGNLKSFVADDAIRLCKTVPEGDRAFFVANWRQLANTEKLRDDVEQLKVRMVRAIVSDFLKWIDDDVTVCPVCGSERAEPIVDIIRSKKIELEINEGQLVKGYAELHHEKSANEIRENLQTLGGVAGSENVNEDDVFGFALCGGRVERAAQLKNAQEELSKIDKEIAALKETKKRFYDNLCKRRDEITNLLEVKFELGATSINFDDANEELVVKMPRKIDTFSTGEIDLMVALVGINEFRASDSDVLVLDDPITSFDMSNQYVILFDLISMVGESKAAGQLKSVVILTHNTNCINIAESQYSGLFSYYSLDRWDDGLRLNPIKLQKDNTRRYLCQETLLKTVEAASFGIASSNGIPMALKKAYVDAAGARERCDDTLHAVFHYNGPSGPLVHNDQRLSNDDLADLIESVAVGDLITKDDFVGSCLDKEIVLLALRVWVEKQFYDDMAGDSSYLSKTDGKSISLKIDYIFPKGGASKWSGSATVTRSYLMGKKVMLNQASHENAQSIPFEYALGLSAYEIQKTVEDVKNHFAGKLQSARG